MAQRDINKWLPVKEKTVWSLFVKYASDGKLYLQIVWNKKQDEGLLPNLSQLRFSSESQVRVAPLITRPELKERNIYIVELNERDKDWLKEARILSFAFTVDEMDSTRYRAFENEFSLEFEIQNKLIKMGKCLL